MLRSFFIILCVLSPPALALKIGWDVDGQPKEDCANPWHPRCTTLHEKHGRSNRHGRRNMVYAELGGSKLNDKIEEVSSAAIASSFTDVIFGFINIGTITTNKNGEPEWEWVDRPGTKPEIAWNDEPIKEKWIMKPYFKKMAESMTLWVSTGAWGNDRTFQFFDKCQKSECNSMATKIKQFMDDFSITGLDIDYEASTHSGFSKLAYWMKHVGVEKFSAAPYSHYHAGGVNPTMDLSKNTSIVHMMKTFELRKVAPAVGPAEEDKGRLTVPPTLGVPWQWCQFAKSDIKPIMNLQFYAGGSVGSNMEVINREIQKEAENSFTCNGKVMKIPQENIIAGLGVSGSWHGGGYGGWQCPSNDFSRCEKFMREIDPKTGGVFTWRLESVMEYGGKSFLTQTPQ